MVDDKKLRKLQRELSRMVANDDEAWEYVLALVETDWREIIIEDQETRRVHCRGCYKPTLRKELIFLSDDRYFCITCQDIVNNGYKYTCPDCRKNFISHSYTNYHDADGYQGKISFRCPECEKKLINSLHADNSYPNQMGNRKCIACGNTYKDIYGYLSLCAACKIAYGVDDRYIRLEYQKINAHLLRAETLDLDATLTVNEWFILLIDAHWLCQYCLTFPYEQLDHFIPLCKGGGTAKNNVIPACKECNKLKGQRHPDIVTSIPREALDRVKTYLSQF